MVSIEDQRTINALQANWVWVSNWVDFSPDCTAGRIVQFTRTFHLSSRPSKAVLHFSADTRYKLYINGERIAVGPSRSSPLIWYYDTLDIARHLKPGQNRIRFEVLRYFAASRCAMPFARTAFPGLTVVGGVICDDSKYLELDTGEEWLAQVDESIKFPFGITDDVFLHIYERVTTGINAKSTTPVNYSIKTLNGELSPWHLRPRAIPMPEQSNVAVTKLRACISVLPNSDWIAYLSGVDQIVLPSNSKHVLEVQADVHSTAFLKWTFKATMRPSQIKLKITYSEGYEYEPRVYPFFRVKGDRQDAKNGKIIGPYDEVMFDLPLDSPITYEPFWFRTFGVIRLEIQTGLEQVTLLSFVASQINYPLDVKATWNENGDTFSEKIWDVSIRTMRNCMLDGYSDCPFYEQLQYAGDSYTVGLFHYLLSGDDRLMRQTISSFSASITSDGLTQSRFPSHVPQVIAGFSLYWILQICDHYLFFGDKSYSRSFLPRIDGVLEFFASRVDGLGLISNLPEDVWQFVDWVTTWAATENHPDKGVPTSGRKSNRHTFFSMLYAYVLKRAAKLARDLGRPGHAFEYEFRAQEIQKAIRAHCYDGSFFTDSTADIAESLAYSQHCQVFAVLSDTALQDDRARLLKESFEDPRFSKCSYAMLFYAFRAFAKAGDEVYEGFWPKMWDPWRKMLANNMTTWEEDDVRQRSDCHAWGSVPIYEYCTELAGVQPLGTGCSKILFKPRLRLSNAITAKVALGDSNLAVVSWSVRNSNEKLVYLKLSKPIEVVSQLPGANQEEHGIIDSLILLFKTDPI